MVVGEEQSWRKVEPMEVMGLVVGWGVWREEEMRRWLWEERRRVRGVMGWFCFYINLHVSANHSTTYLSGTLTPI